MAIFPENYPSKYPFIIPEKVSLEDALFVKKRNRFFQISTKKKKNFLKKTFLHCCKQSKSIIPINELLSFLTKLQYIIPQIYKQKVFKNKSTF